MNMDKINWNDRIGDAPCDEVLYLKLGRHIWEGRIWKACPDLDPIDSPMPTHWSYKNKT